MGFDPGVLLGTVGREYLERTGGWILVVFLEGKL
jgi:hypothetical protein